MDMRIMHTIMVVMILGSLPVGLIRRRTIVYAVNPLHTVRVKTIRRTFIGVESISQIRRTNPIPHGTNTHIGDPTVWGRNIAKTTLPTHRAGQIGGGKTRVETTHISGTNPGPSKTIAQMGKTWVRRGMMGEKHVPTAEGASLD